jgi:hypothetical protein
MKNNSVLEKEIAKGPNALFSTLKENITVTTNDNGAEDYQDVFLNISNTNDPPNVVVLSSHYNHNGLNRKSHSSQRASGKLLLVMLCLLIPLGFASAFSLTNHYINNANPDSKIYTDANLTCYWTLNETGAVNVSWYKNSIGVLNRTQQNINCTADTECYTFGSGNVPSADTTKEDMWICIVTFWNSTEFENSTINANISDSSPTTPKFYWENGTYISNSSVAQIFEANPPVYNATTFIVNSSDADGENITFEIDDPHYYCELSATSNTSAALTCNPTDESDNGIERTIYIWAKSGASGRKLAAQSLININVIATNDPPIIIYSLCTATVNESQPLNCIIYGTDDDSDWPLNFTIASDLGNRLVINESNNTAVRLVFNNSGENKAIYNDRGNHTVNITVVDNNSEPRTTYGSFVLQINQTPNHAPNLSISVINSTSLIQFGSLVIYMNATDVDNDTLVFRTNYTALYNVTNYNSTEYQNSTGVFAEAWINITNLTNDHVINRNIKIIVSDGKINTSQDVFLNITNVNDPPQIFETSNNSTNTLNNINISDLVAYTGVLFIYAVNYTDIDFLTYEGDTLIFWTNDSRFNISSSTGMLSFTPNESEIGDFNFIIFARDQNGSGITVNRTATIHISLNHNPYFTYVPTISCSEYDSTNNPYSCYYNISANVSDEDIPSGDYIALFSTNATFFQINQTAGIINFTPDQSQIGNYSLTLNITDSRGGFNSTTIYLIINNTNNPPKIDPLIMPGDPYVVGRSYQFTVLASDLDLELNNSYENLTFNQSVDGPNSTLFILEKVAYNQARITFNPSATTDAGNYTINVSVTDTYNNVTSLAPTNVFIFNMTGAPSIINITPFGTPFVNNSINTSWMPASNFTINSTNITIYENSTYLFNQSSTLGAGNGYQNNLSYAWYFDGVLTSNEASLNADRINYFNFFSSGMHNITLAVRDYYGSNASFKWLINVTNVNRPPLFITDLSNLTVNGTTAYNDYLNSSQDASSVHFIDPDDDLNSNNYLDDGEIDNLTYQVSSCSVANISIFNKYSIRIIPEEIEVCYVYFTATDSGGRTAISNTLKINVTDFDNETSKIDVPQPTSGGGGGRSTSVVIPITKKEDKPQALELIVPELVTIYENKTVLIPITLQNTWNSTLKSIQLNASTNASEVKMSFTDDFFSEIPVGGEQHTTLMVTNYRMGENYNIKITANVSEPKTSDTATVMLNAIEQSKTGEQVETKVTFAQDLLNENPECLELNELLSKAKDELALGNSATASDMVDGVINGCKYLVSISKKSEQKPSNILTKVIQKENSIYFIIFGIMATVLLLSVLLVKHKKSKAIKDKKQAEEKAKHEEEQSRPYWPGMQ